MREHLAFGRGAHSCPGGPLARVEGRVSVERILDRMTDIQIDEEIHGPADARRFSYEPTFILRGLTDVQHHVQRKAAPADGGPLMTIAAEPDLYYDPYNVDLNMNPVSGVRPAPGGGTAVLQRAARLLRTEPLR